MAVYSNPAATITAMAEKRLFKPKAQEEHREHTNFEPRGGAVLEVLDFRQDGTIFLGKHSTTATTARFAEAALPTPAPISEALHVREVCEKCAALFPFSRPCSSFLSPLLPLFSCLFLRPSLFIARFLPYF